MILLGHLKLPRETVPRSDVVLAQLTNLLPVHLLVVDIQDPDAVLGPRSPVQLDLDDCAALLSLVRFLRLNLILV